MPKGDFFPHWRKSWTNRAWKAQWPAMSLGSREWNLRGSVPRELPPQWLCSTHVVSAAKLWFPKGVRTWLAQLWPHTPSMDRDGQRTGQTTLRRWHNGKGISQKNDWAFIRKRRTICCVDKTNLTIPKFFLTSSHLWTQEKSTYFSITLFLACLLTVSVQK